MNRASGIFESTHYYDSRPSGVKFQIANIELLYEAEDFSMVVILPDSGKFEEVESSLDSNQLRSIINNLQSPLVELKLKMPRFTYCSDFLGLKDILSQMGMPNTFNCADFFGIDGTHNLYLFDCFHKAFIRVNEEGTEAAVSSAAILDYIYCFRQVKKKN